VIIPAQQQEQAAHKTGREEVRHIQAQKRAEAVCKSLVEDHHYFGRDMELEEELDYIAEVGGKGQGQQREVVGNLLEELGLLGFAIRQL